MGELSQFRSAFEKLTGYLPFPWQEELYLRWFSLGNIPPACNLPTGLGKTSVIAIWLIALANDATKIPRRLVYVVNRRTVVDQTTDEVERLRENLRDACLFEPLKGLCALLGDGEYPLAVSTLRGEFADNREWSADPCRPAVIVGTVDMIGSRLLFSAYRAGFKTKPLYAGFLGKDALLIHDEAHLEPAFQNLLISIKEEQKRCGEFGKFHVMALTATSRDGGDTRFELTEEEKNPPEDLPEPAKPLHLLWRRLTAKKGIKPHTAQQEDVVKHIGVLACERKDSGKAILVFVRKVDDVKTVRDVLEKAGVEKNRILKLTGTLRGFERDALVKTDLFKRFLLTAPSDGQTVYLICTSAGEVGIDISADHLICDLTPLDSMVQRLGRVNRRGDGEAVIDVAYESDPDPKEQDDGLERARWKTLEVLKSLPRCDWAADRWDASPLTLLNLSLSEDQRKAAFTPEPVMLTATDILFDSWALTTIRDKLPGRAPVEPYLHGLSKWEPPETYVAWRDEVGIITGDLLNEYDPEDLLEDYPLKPQELLRDRSDRVFKNLGAIAKRKPNAPVWLLDDDDNVEVLTLEQLTHNSKRDRVNHVTVLLPPEAGGLCDGLMKGDSEEGNYDVADKWLDEKGNCRRVRIWDDEPVPERMRLIRKIDTESDSEDKEEGETSTRRYWYWYELPKSADSDGSKNAKGDVDWSVHTNDVICNTAKIVHKLPSLSCDLQNALILAAKFHDLGKRRQLFQRILNNMNYPAIVLAKSGKKKPPVGLKEDYRHEFGSLLDVQNESEFQRLSVDLKELVLHLIATHHGRGRPHFPSDEAFDPEPNGRDYEAVAMEVPGRFARLQRKYGRWGLAYLESLLRAADYAASATPSKFLEDKP